MLPLYESPFFHAQKTSGRRPEPQERPARKGITAESKRLLECLGFLFSSRLEPLRFYSGEKNSTLSFLRTNISRVPQSLLAIWLAWLMPTGILEQPAAPDIKSLKSRTKPPRRPIPPHLPLDVQTNLAPIILPTNAADNQQPTRHVYFADAAPDATTVNQAMVSEPLPQTPDILQSNVPSQVTEASPQSSVLVPSENPGGPSESLDSLVLDSDSSSRPSSLKRPGFSKFKLFRSYSLDVNPTSMTSDG